MLWKAEDGSYFSAILLIFFINTVIPFQIVLHHNSDIFPKNLPPQENEHGLQKQFLCKIDDGILDFWLG